MNRNASDALTVKSKGVQQEKERGIVAMEVMIVSEVYKIRDRPMVTMDTMSVPKTLSQAAHAGTKGGTCGVKFLGRPPYLCSYDLIE